MKDTPGFIPYGSSISGYGSGMGIGGGYGVTLTKEQQEAAELQMKAYQESMKGASNTNVSVGNYYGVGGGIGYGSGIGGGYGVTLTKEQQEAAEKQMKAYSESLKKTGLSGCDISSDQDSISCADGREYKLSKSEDQSGREVIKSIENTTVTPGKQSNSQVQQK